MVVPPAESSWRAQGPGRAPERSEPVPAALSRGDERDDTVVARMPTQLEQPVDRPLPTQGFAWHHEPERFSQSPIPYARSTRNTLETVGSGFPDSSSWNPDQRPALPSHRNDPICAAAKLSTVEAGFPRCGPDEPRKLGWLDRAELLQHPKLEDRGLRRACSKTTGGGTSISGAYRSMNSTVVCATSTISIFLTTVSTAL